MAHYAFLDDKNIVTEVIVGIDETQLIEGLDSEEWYGQFRGQTCIRTSYSGRIRFNFAGIGYKYDEEADAFIAPKPICGHKELFLSTISYQWQCQGCELDAKRLLDEQL